MDNFKKTENICRICLVQNNEETLSVFNTIDPTGEPQQFSEMLMTFAKIEINSGDGLPDKICSTCAQNTIILYLFKIKCEESDKTLRNRLKEGFFIDKIDIDEEQTFDKLKPEITEENVEVCDVLKESGGDAHCAQQNDNNPLDIIVYEDYEACTSPKYGESLNGNTTDNTLSIAEESLEDDSSQEIKDVIRLEKIAELSQIIKIMDQNFDSQRHEINKEKSSQNLIETSFNDSKKNTFECDVCKQRFTEISTLTIHKRTHTVEKPFECDVCKKRFRIPTFLLIHKRTHKGEKWFECYVCKQRFTASSHLIAHYNRTHKGEKPFECDVCKQRFNASSGLIVHKRTHTGEKPFECDVCKKRFNVSSSLIVHKRTHTVDQFLTIGN